MGLGKFILSRWYGFRAKFNWKTDRPIDKYFELAETREYKSNEEEIFKDGKYITRSQITEKL